MELKGQKVRHTKSNLNKPTLKDFLNLLNDDARIMINDWEVGGHTGGKNLGWSTMKNLKKLKMFTLMSMK